jgi:hypothetical protein
MTSIPHDIRDGINHWLHALALFGKGTNELTVRSNTVFELSDDFFDGHGSPATEIEWFRVSGRRFEIFLDDDVSTVRLANRYVLQNLHGDADRPLVNWFGYKAEAYELVLHTQGDVVPDVPVDGNRLAWIGWDYRAWRTFMFDGSRLAPVSQAGAASGGLDLDVNRITWMGWDGENLDIFTSRFPQVPETTVAVLVGKDDSVLAVHRPVM